MDHVHVHCKLKQTSLDKGSRFSLLRSLHPLCASPTLNPNRAGRLGQTSFEPGTQAQTQAPPPLLAKDNQPLSIPIPIAKGRKQVKATNSCMICHGHGLILHACYMFMFVFAYDRGFVFPYVPNTYIILYPVFCNCLAVVDCGR